MPRTSRVPRPRGTARYDKPAMTLDELISRLSERGMIIPHRDRALRYLRHIGYYRLSPYTIPFQKSRPDHLLRDGTSFDDVLDLYVFDRALRLIVMDALERVEVAVRAAVTDHMSTTYDDPFWYGNPEHFGHSGKYDGLLKIVRETSAAQLLATPELVDAADADGDAGSSEQGSSAVIHRSALEHYLTTYKTPELPPSWLMVETMTMGQLASLYLNLKLRSDRTAVAASLGLTGPVLESWSQTYVRVRNVCAHHGRLWNVGLGRYPVIPTSKSVAWLRSSDGLPERSRKRLYPVLVSLQTILGTVSPRSSWAARLHDLISNRPAMNLAGMGVPDGWIQDDFWRGFGA
ncbi:Abi family protein [Rathayibacter toxicus]|uniref:Abi family protein n=1 Tax=Rathayibacter toxicus TaxID=145458 RepID=UPI001C752CA2|nr:Abi family protein [Rathayibacter toxicus]QWL32467.1 Abi family protein [Rathayibacter toxicus]QWL34561.1 Abi family protein [Rathayibacter toxicus]QWL36693.1 Abi family protein [Rathayibacter toxicus]QWL38782.1 Abi family protein [Rathayibacter toxicus]QWL40870.1 Abi family protein [Rathayibacter toxicus]